VDGRRGEVVALKAKYVLYLGAQKLALSSCVLSLHTCPVGMRSNYFFFFFFFRCLAAAWRIWLCAFGCVHFFFFLKKKVIVTCAFTCLSSIFLVHLQSTKLADEPKRNNLPTYLHISQYLGTKTTGKRDLLLPSSLVSHYFIPSRQNFPNPGGKESS
jgi:hypothetical protein